MKNTNRESPNATRFRASVKYWQVVMQEEVANGIAGGMGMHEYIIQSGGSWTNPGLFPLQVCGKALDEKEGYVAINERAMELIVLALDAAHGMEAVLPIIHRL